MSRIAVIGSGISGMAIAYFASRRHEVTLFEREPRLGGHTHTVPVSTREGVLGVDTGFIVLNEPNYPNLVRLFRELGVETQPSDMSFSVASGRGGFEWSSRGFSGLFADRANLVNPRFYAFLGEIVRFNRRAPRLLDEPDGGATTLSAFLAREGFTRAFRESYLLPMAGAVWSTPLEKMNDFPAATLVRFFQNHGFLGVRTQRPWRAVRGGSASYIPLLTAPYRNRIRLASPVERVTRERDGVTVRVRGQEARFDEAVFACHGDEALPMLSDASEAEREVLSAFRTSANPTWLHTDTSVLPRRRRAWASWNALGSGEDAGRPRVTYHMNRLQRLCAAEDYCVTLHPEGFVDESRAIRKLAYRHPLYDAAVVRAQGRWEEISGVRGTHYCGAHWGYGFHEDGLTSALRVASRLGVSW
jgi:predicted NAD/FAD-binding protein